MARYSRVTLVGTRRRADIVLPSDEPVGLLLADLLELLDEPAGPAPRPRQLVDPAGQPVPSGESLASAEVPDGAVLRLVTVEDSPPAPVVHDVTEETAEGVDSLSWRWSPAALRWTATAFAVVSFTVLGLVAAALAGGRSGVVVLATGAGIGCLLGAAVAQLREPVGTAVILGSGSLALQTAWGLAGTDGWSPGARWLLLAAVASALVALLGLATPLGRGGWVGGGFGLLLTALWAAGTLATLPPPRLAAVMVLVAVVLLGFLPRLALVLAGLTRLDDARTVGAGVTRQDVRGALAAAHRGLLVSAVAVAVSVAASGWLLSTHPDRWTLALAGLLVVIVFSRARLYPLVGQVLALVAAAAVVLGALLLTWLRHDGGASVATVAAVAAGVVICVALLAVRPPEHVRTRLRRIFDRVEAVAVLATVPVAVGVFGTYSRLLAIF
jgi:type VII secretion integral membrane protein EccD